MTKREIYWLIPCLLITIIAFLPVVQHDFLNWDDPAYVLKNPLIRDISFPGIQKMFTTGHVVSTYAPLVLLSWGIDYALWGLNPQMFHVTNLILHVVVVFLIFYFTKQLSKNVKVAFITALLFGIHPMHVEAVSWISARKDLLYTFFFLGALIIYNVYTDSEDKKQQIKMYIACIVLYGCSLLSKGSAVVFPLMLFLIDFYKRRSDIRQMIIEKIPFFALSIVFFYIAVVMQSEGGAMEDRAFTSWIDSFGVGFYGYLIYLIKSIIPFGLGPYHPYPNELGEPNPWYYYAAAIPVLLLFGYIVKTMKRKRYLVLGFGFFFISLIPVIQVLPFGTAVIAERYTYLPYLGLFFLIGLGLHHLYEQYQSKKQLIQIGTGVFIVVLGVITFQYVKVYENGETFWSHVIEQYPDNFMGYMNRTNHRMGQQQYNLALEDADNAIKASPENPWLWYNRALVYKRMDKNGLSLKDLDKAIQLDHNFTSGYMNRGVIFGEAKQIHKAIGEFSKVIELNPERYLGYYNRALFLKQTGAYKEALKDINKVIALQQNLIPQSYYLRAELQMNFGKIDEAISDFTQVIALDPNMEASYNKRGQLYVEKRNLEAALQDFNEIIKLNENHSEAYINRGFVFMNQSKLYEASLDFKRAKELTPNDHSIYYNMAILYQLAGKYPEALRELEECLRLNSEFKPAITTQTEIQSLMNVN